MKPIIAPVDRTKSGPAIVNLQEGLLLLLRRELIQVPQDRVALESHVQSEQNRQEYGSSTTKLAGFFQAQNQLAGEGDIIDVPTAEALNRMLKDLGAFNGATSDGQPASAGFIVRGRVFRPDNSPWAGVTVTAYDKDLRGEQQLNATPTKTDREGKFEVPYTSQQFSAGDTTNPELAADLFFEIRDQERNIDKLRLTRVPSDGELLKPAVLIGERQVIFNARKTEVVEIRTDAPDGEAPRSLSEYERLLAAITPVLGALSVAELTSEDVAFLTGETEQDAVHLSFLADAAKRARQTDLPTEVFYGLFREGLPTELPALLVEGPDKIREALKAAISDNIIPHAIDANLQGILNRFRELIVEQAFQTPEEGRYSLSSLLALSLPDQDRQRKFLQAYYAHEGPIQEFWKVTATNDLGMEKPQIQDLQFNLQLGGLTQQHVPLISAVRKDERGFKSPRDLAVLEKEDWLKFIAGTTGNMVGIPPGIPGADGQKESNYVENIIGTLQVTFPTQFAAQVAVRTTDSAINAVKDVLAKFFQKANNFEEPEGSSTFSVGDLIDLPSFVEKLKQPATEDHVSPYLVGQLSSNTQNLLANYNGGSNPVLQKALVDDLNRIISDASIYEAGRFAGVVLRQETQDLLKRNPQGELLVRFNRLLLEDAYPLELSKHQNFDFRTTPVNSYLRQHGDKVFEGVSEAERLTATTQLKRMGRAFQMSSGPGPMRALLESGFDSAQGITRLSQQDFVDSMKDKLGGEDAARDVYAKADHISATVQHLFANMWSESQDVLPFVMRTPQQNSESQP